MLILHVARRDEWEAAEATGYYTGNTLSTEGFIHAAKPDQLMHVLTKWFPTVVNHVLVELDTEKIEPELKWEGNSDLFPHIYGPLNLTSVTRTKKIW
jgi:uncharacterized protein (DUF952 family)